MPQPLPQNSGDVINLCNKTPEREGRHRAEQRKGKERSKWVWALSGCIEDIKTCKDETGQLVILSVYYIFRLYGDDVPNLYLNLNL